MPHNVIICCEAPVQYVGDSSSTPVKYYQLFLFYLPDSEHLMMSLFIGEYVN